MAMSIYHVIVLSGLNFITVYLKGFYDIVSRDFLIMYFDRGSKYHNILRDDESRLVQYSEELNNFCRRFQSISVGNRYVGK